MMLNISFSNLRTGIVQYLPFGLFIGMLILAELLLALVPWEFKDAAFSYYFPPDRAPQRGERTGDQRVL